MRPAQSAIMSNDNDTSEAVHMHMHHPPARAAQSPDMSNRALQPLQRAARALPYPLSRGTLDRLARSGEIPVVRIGRRWYADPQELVAALVKVQS
jgi:hypothetical protein